MTERFRSTTDETPDFRRHILPLLNRNGCNAAACHGAKEGQAGFQLSLFGYDLEADHRELAEEGNPTRANWLEPEKSALLLKPSLQEDHEGGYHFDEESWQYRLLLNWIRARAPGVATRMPAEIERLRIEPAEILFQADVKTVPLRAIAYWDDGTAEDVTPLCRFQSNDESVAVIDEEGVVSRRRSGDTHIIAFYDQMIVPVPVLAPYAGEYPKADVSREPATKVDRFVNAKLAKLRIEPSGLCTDSEFLRRAHIDLTGTLPTARRIREFLADADPAKRSRVIEELLESDEYASCWTTFLCDLTGNSEGQMPDPAFRREQSQQWYDWLAHRVKNNVPYDEIVEGIVCGTSRSPGTSYDDYCAEMSAYARQEKSSQYSDRENLPLFWARYNMRSPVNKTLAFSHVFLGVRLQCAECHKHPFDRWTKDDFDGLKAFFEPLSYRYSPEGQRHYDEFRAANVPPDIRNTQGFVAKLAREGKIIPWRELFYRAGNQRRSSTDTFTKNSSTTGADPLDILMEWVRDTDHPYLAIAFVNRVWQHYFGIGIIEPADDLSLANPPSNRPLLDYLAAGFIDSGYDMKWLHREIVSSAAYQRSWQADSRNGNDQKNFSHKTLRRLPAEVLYDAVWLATADNQEAALRSPRRAVGPISGMTRSEGLNTILGELGKPDRSAVCENERSNEPSLTQAFFLQNDPIVEKMISRPEAWTTVAIAQLSSSSAPVSDEATLHFIKEAYLRTLSRLPTEREITHCRRYIEESESPADGVRGIIWMLLNTKEFCVHR